MSEDSLAVELLQDVRGHHLVVGRGLELRKVCRIVLRPGPASSSGPGVDCTRFCGYSSSRWCTPGTRRWTSDAAALVDVVRTAHQVREARAALDLL